MKILRAASHRRMPWKNGGGETIEIAICPEKASISDFDWRVSMAVVATDGPFSKFEDVDRTLSILAGQGMSLSINGDKSTLMVPGDNAVTFPGDVPAHATLHDGPITDLNVMSRRHRYSHSVERLSIRGHRTLPVCGVSQLLVFEGNDLVVAAAGQHLDIAATDALLVEPGELIEFHGEGICHRVIFQIAEG